METVIAIAAVTIVIIQAHRNYLMIKAASKTVPVPEVHVTVEAPLLPEPVALQAFETVNFDNTVLEAILERLTEVASRPVQPIYPVVIPNPPSIQPNPYWQSPTISETGTGNETEINGVPGKRFPNPNRS